MEKIELTKEMLAEARDYMTNALKEAWVSETAPKCFDRLAITADKDPLPPMYMVNMGLKSRYLMTIFVHEYLRQPFEVDPTDEMLMSEADFDRWAGNHIFCQLAKLKNDASVRDKCYNIIYDYHDLEKRLTAQLNGLLTVQNDSVLRENQLMAAQIQQLPQVREQLLELIEKHKEADDGET